jgi:hypothetical protein
VDLPNGCVEGVDVLAEEELGGGVRSLGDGDPPVPRDGRALIGGHRPADRRGGFAVAQDVADAERAAAVTAELAEGEGGGAAQVLRHVEAAGDEDVAAQPALGGLADVQHAAGRDVHGLPVGHGYATDGDGCGGAGDADRGRRGEAQRRTVDGAFQAGGAFGVAEGAIAEAEGEVVHRPGRRDTDLPQAGTAGPVLHRGQRAGPFDDDAWLGVVYIGEGGGAVPGGQDALVGSRGAQQAEVGLDAVHAGGREGGAQFRVRLVTGGTDDDDLGEHRVVRGGHLGAGLHPAVDAYAVREPHAGDQAGAGPVPLGGVLGVDAGLNGGTGGPAGCVEDGVVALGEA